MSNGPRVPGGNPADPFPIVNDALDVYAHQEVYAIDPTEAELLTFYYLGGRWGGFPITDGSVALTDNAENYIVVTRSSGVLSVSTNTTNWNDTDDYARVYHITTLSGVRQTVRDYRAGPNGVHGQSSGGGGGGGGGTQCIPVAISDETTALTAGVAKVTFRMPYAFTLSEVRASVTIAPTGAALIFDINETGASILSTKLSIDASEKTSTTAATPPVISDTALADDAEITIDIDQIGSTIPGAGAKIYLIGVKT